jgi:hypothetical protein
MGSQSEPDLFIKAVGEFDLTRHLLGHSRILPL